MTEHFYVLRFADGKFWSVSGKRMPKVYMACCFPTVASVARGFRERPDLKRPGDATLFKVEFTLSNAEGG